MPMPAAIASRGEWPTNGRPLNTIVPASGGTIPKRMFISVVLPEPFSPRRPTMRPGATSRSIERFACTEPNDFEIPCMRSIVAPCTLVKVGEGSDAAARVFLDGLDLEVAGGDLLLDRLQLGRDRRGHRGIERAVGGVAEIGAAGRRVVAVGDVAAAELPRAEVGHRGRVDVSPLLVDVGENALGRDGGVAERPARREDVLLLGGLDDAGLSGVQLAADDVGAARDEREGGLLRRRRIFHRLQIDDL